MRSIHALDAGIAAQPADAADGRRPPLIGNALGGNKMKNIAAAIVGSLLWCGCATRHEAIQARAQVVTWTNKPLVMVVELCDSGVRYQLGVFTSNAALGATEVEKAIAASEDPVVVELTGFPASLPSSWVPAPDVVGVLSVGHIAVSDRRSCP